eukprot:CAMPEP_0119107160 /NCGR_PEP_ID=MMETSP1180-20130426/8684_1 /TAXON_ID=3052 ORGANISM="Chlamydomonas cf sp, Strain CCMP681" /NCGR_SAMPLE_ID=MMETSP1180 /ASSEMBLY_ACC=CAM_ASM_000741 /LENGTH=68 /DNA_ID=CAMNT_0007092609 /DNA_START=132 /DNA_END=338 /DNA_ORIENTATION=+
MTVSKRVANAKTAKFQQGVFKRGAVQEGTTARKEKLAVGPVMLGFFLFVVVGSALLQIIRTATSPPPL